MCWNSSMKRIRRNVVFVDINSVFCLVVCVHMFVLYLCLCWNMTKLSSGRQWQTVYVHFFFKCEHKLQYRKVFAAVVHLSEGHHTGDQSGADLVQLSLRTNGPSGNCLSLPSTLSSHSSSSSSPPACLLDFTCWKAMWVLLSVWSQTWKKSVWWQLPGKKAGGGWSVYEKMAFCFMAFACYGW